MSEMVTAKTIMIERQTSSAFYTVPGGDSTSPNSRTFRKIQAFNSLPTGWHYGVGGPAHPLVIRFALRFLWQFAMLGFVETDAFPGAGGEIMVTAYRGDNCLEVTAELDSSFTISHQFRGETRFYEPGLSNVEACIELSNLVIAIEQEECASSGLLISSNTMIQGAAEGSLTLPSAQWETPHLSFSNHAASLRVGQFVPILPRFTRPLAALPQHSGNLIPLS